MKHQESVKNKFFNGFVAVIAIIIAFMAGLMLGSGSKVAVTSESGEIVNPTVEGVGEMPDFLKEDVDFDLFWDAWETIVDNYADQPVNQSKLLYGALKGMVSGLEDQHSVFFTPDLNEEFMQELSGKFYGIGAEIAVKSGQLQIVAPLSGSPAERAGLRPGDFILSVDGEDMTGKAVDYAVSKIRGDVGTKVKITIYRQGEKETREVEIIREEIKIISVEWKKLDNQVALIELKYFNGDTAREFNRVTNEVVGFKPKHIILDMRNNPGGYLDVAIEIGSQFVEDGVIVSEKMFNGELNEHKAVGKAKLAGIPVTVLVNEGSASASEIVAGALKDYGIAKIIGKKSFGKGSVQTLFDLKDGSSIKLTIAKWLTPNGNTIEGEGITPDIEVELTPEDFSADKDPQLDKAIELINEPVVQ